MMRQLDMDNKGLHLVCVLTLKVFTNILLCFREPLVVRELLAVMDPLEPR